MAEGVPKAFVSYCREDSEFALRLAGDLKAAGASVWMDQLDIVGGQRWDHCVEDALKECARTLVILSPAAIESTNTMDEVSFALENQKTVIPVMNRDCEVPFRLRRLQYVDFRRDYARGLKDLLKILAPEASQLSEEEETALGLVLADPRAGDRGVWAYPLHQQLTYRGFSDVQATGVLNGLVSKGVLLAVDVPTSDDRTDEGPAPAYRVTALGFTYAKNSKRLQSFRAQYRYFVTLRGTQKHNQPFLNQLRSLEYVQKSTRFIIENDRKLSKIAVFSYQPLDQETLRNMAQMHGVEVVSLEEHPG